MKKPNVRLLVLAALFLALAMVLPLLIGQIPEIGQALSPMHIPVLLCGFICGPLYGAAVGFVSPLLRFAIFGMPPIFPTGVAMAFELLTYGAISGILYKKLPRRVYTVYITLIAAMLAGRVVWGAVRLIIAGLSGSAFSWSMFMAGAFTNAVPGIICHIILIPIIILALEKAGLVRKNS